jgi:hypothetical protein
MTAVYDRQRMELVSGVEPWSYGDGYAEGWAAGHAEGRRVGFAEGYRVGFDAGAEVGGTRVLLGVEAALAPVCPGQVLDLLAGVPHMAGWADYRARAAWSDEPCEASCGRCSRCIRAAAVPNNRRRYGRPDFPGRST